MSQLSISLLPSRQHVLLFLMETLYIFADRRKTLLARPLTFHEWKWALRVFVLSFLILKLYFVFHTAECFINLEDATEAGGCILESSAIFPLSPDVLYMVCL